MYKANIRRWVRKVLDDDRKPTGQIYDCFYSFAREPRPSWWNNDIAPPALGEILGIHENVPGDRTGSIIITDIGIVLLGAGSESTWIPYSEIGRIGTDLLQKEPIPSTSLSVWTRRGEHIVLPFESERGGAFGFVQFLSGARQEHERARKRTD